MVQALKLAAAGTGFCFLMTTLGAGTVFFLSSVSGGKWEKILLGFAAGVMTAASVWSLLLPALAQAGWFPVDLGLLAGGLVLAALDRWLVHLRKGRAGQNLLLLTAITLHNIPEGMAVGLAFALAAQHGGLAAAWALALGIGIQNFPEGAAVSLPLRQEGHSQWRAFRGGMLSGAVEPLFGVAVVFISGWAGGLMPWFLSFAAGAMFYVVVRELVPESRGDGGTWGFFAGFLVMMTLDTALG